MQAIQIMQPGGPEALKPVELEVPTPGPGEVLIKVAAAGVNFADVLFRQGVYPLTHPVIPGYEVAGTIAGRGPDIDGLTVGMRVVATLWVPGGYAEYVVAAAPSTVPLYWTP